VTPTTLARTGCSQDSGHPQGIAVTGIGSQSGRANVHRADHEIDSLSRGGAEAGRGSLELSVGLVDDRAGEILIAAHEGGVRSLNREQASRYRTHTLRIRRRGIDGLAVDRWWFLSGITSRQHCNKQAPSAGPDQGDPPVEWILHCMNHRRFGPERVTTCGGQGEFLASPA